jgi:serine/threonine protein kinase
MSDENPGASQVLRDALDITALERRQAFVAAACRGDPQLLAEVEELLRARERTRHDDDALGDGNKTTPFVPSSGEFDETTLGPYQLRALIAEGGMGMVYEAYQEGPVRRSVAVKIIKPGSDSQDVIARFETERQTLALMDHPNIASVLDAGYTTGGQPFFVMELVRGMPITAHCDAHRLSIRDRLQLFMQVCHAVQHAHQKGIIHRDIKPTNVMVAMVDGQPVPKIIDFGVAKALDQSLSDQSPSERFTQMVGTPLYMSPEQASLDVPDIDTRSDIYSLGVLLYELLAGTAPYDMDQFDKVAYGEFRRIKQEEQPPPPSVRVNSLTGKQLGVVASQRGVSPVRFRRLLHGELDWIVMKALDRDRQARYQTARGLAADVQRYLNNDPVEAAPSTTWYTTRKVVSRHVGLITAASLIAATLILGTAVSVWQAVRATRAERLATQRAIIADNALKAADLAHQQSLRNRAQALSANGSFLMAVKKYELALQQFQAACNIDPESPFLNNNYAWFLANCPDARYSDPPLAVELAEKAVAAVPDEGMFWNTLGVSHYRAGNWRAAVEALQRSAQLFGDTGIGFNAVFLAMAQWQLGNRDEAHRHYEAVLRWMRDNDGGDEELRRFCQEAATLLGRVDGVMQAPTSVASPPHD